MLRSCLRFTAFVVFVVFFAACQGPAIRGLPEREAPTDTLSCTVGGNVTAFSATAFDEWVSLTWSCTECEEDGFILERRDEGDIVWGELLRLAADTTFFNDYGARHDTRYSYRVRAFRDFNSEYCETTNSDEAGVITAPNAAEDLVVLPSSPDTLELAWLDPNHYEDGYRIERRRDGGAFAVLVEVAADATLHADRGLSAGEYEYRLTAFNESGSSEGIKSSAVIATQRTPEPPALDWGEPPYLTNTCELVIPGTSVFDTEVGATYASASAELSVTTESPGPKADAAGLWATLGEVSAGFFAATWRVVDSLGGTTTRPRLLHLSLESTPLDVARMPTFALDDDYTIGRQALLPRCSDCTIGAAADRRGSIALSESFACAVTEVGRVGCWGRNRALGFPNGQLGAGDPISDQPFPLPVCSGEPPEPCAAPLSGALRITASKRDNDASHTCVIGGDGRVRCWGYDDQGRLGDGTFVLHSSDSWLTRGYPAEACLSGSGPTCVPLGSANAVAAGGYVTCAASAGKAYCWGHNFRGALGIGTVGLASDPAFPTAVPVCVDGQLVDGVCTGGGQLSGVIGLAAGTRHVCAVDESGDLFCWGLNQDGQVGTGTLEPGRPNPVHVLSGVDQVVTGSDHTCALTTDRRVKCWGDNDYGQLGVGYVGDPDPRVSSPTDVCGPGTYDTGAGCPPLTEAKQLSAGNWLTCAIAGPQSTVYCWGRDWNGKVGNDVQPGDEPSPIPVCLSGTGLGCEPLTDVAAIFSGTNHTCAVLAGSGEVRCWGANTAGSLGNGEAGWSRQAVPVCLSLGGPECPRITGVVAGAAGEEHSCVLLGNGDVRCWGDGYYGNLGLGFAHFSTNPLTVCRSGIGMTCEPFENAVQVATGPAFACAVTATKELHCWGNNDHGQAGFGIEDWIRPPTSPHASPVCASGARDSCVPLTGVVAVATGGFFATSFENHSAHACALLDDGTVRCWGNNEQGQVGGGFVSWVGPPTYGLQVVPAPVLCGSSPNCSGGLLSDVVGLTLGFQHSCALHADGAVVCWGRNSSGQLGNGETVAEIPFYFDEDGDGVIEDGEFVWMTATQRPAPSLVPLGQPALQVAAGPGHTCAVMADTSVSCWGWHDLGRLGDGIEGAYDRAVPSPVCARGSGAECEPLTGAVGIAVGSSTSCALMQDGGVKCWGYNVRGAIGHGLKTPSSAQAFGVNWPTDVCAPSTAPCKVCNDDDMDGRCDCNDADENGQCDGCPDEDANLECDPVCPDKLTGAVALAVGASNACVLHADGAMSCWGRHVAVDFESSADADACAPAPVCAQGLLSCSHAGIFATAAARECQIATVTVVED